MNNHAPNATISHEKIRTPAHHEERNLLFRAVANQTGETFLRLRFRPKLRRSSDAHGRMLGERFVELDYALAHDVEQLIEHCQIADECSTLCVNVSRSQRDDQIARLNSTPEFVRDLLTLRLKAAPHLTRLLSNGIHDG